MGVRPNNCCPSETVCRRFPSSIFTFVNNDVIEPPTTSGIADPYPSKIAVSGLNGAISKVTVTLFNVFTIADNLEILLVHPNGVTNTILMKDAGNNFRLSAITLTIDDNATSFLPYLDDIPTGTYRPTVFEGIENLPAPAPPSSGSVALSNFNGLDPNGTWSLYVNDDEAEGKIFIQQGWALSISTPETEEWI